MDEQEFIKNFGMTRDEYAQKYGVLEDPNKGKEATIRQKAVDKVAGVLQNIGYGDQYSSYDAARGLLGSYENPMSEGGIGVLDFTPIQIPFAIQEAKRAYDRGDYLESGLGAGFAAIETAPGIKLATTPVKNFFKSLSRKSSPVDPSRRSAMTTIAAAPLAVGALSEVPVGKIIEDVMPTKISPVVREFDDLEKVMNINTFDFDENPKQYVEFMREIFSEFTGLPKNKYDDFFLGERAIHNKLSGYNSIEEYAEKMLGPEDAQKFLEKNKIDLDFYKTADISAENASVDLRKKLVEGVDTGEKGLSKFDELGESFGDFNAEESMDSDYSVEPLIKDQMLQKTYGKGDIDWEEFVQTEGQKTSRFKELKKVIDEIDALTEANKPRLIPKEKLSAREIREMKEYQDMMDRGSEF